MKKLKKNPLFFSIALFFFSFVIFQAHAQSTLKPNSTPTEIYGQSDAPIKIRIANGGAGPTGIIRALADDYFIFLKLDSHKIKNKHAENFSIAWYQNISKNSLLELKENHVDMAFVYEPQEIENALKEGWASDRTRIFYDHFLIAGPHENPARIDKRDTAKEAFKKIAESGKKLSQSLFLSRNDQSGTNIKEQSIWSSLGFFPWKDNSKWYVKAEVFPSVALKKADAEKLYILTDRGTWLSERSQLHHSDLYVQGSTLLLNPCESLISKTSKKDPHVQDFLKYLKSERAQNVIREFGKDRLGGYALFTPASEPEFQGKQLL